MLFWLTAIGGFVLLVSIQAMGFYLKLNKNVVSGLSIVIMMAAVWLGIEARREDLKTERLAIDRSSFSGKPLE
jgi:hypothetical protein